jgi:hypothetical protein
MNNITLVEHGDAHWYTSPKLSGKYLPSVSTVLGTLKDGLEFVSAWDLRKAQERGIKLHTATEMLERGETIDRGFYDDKEWLMLMGFIRWWKEYNPTVVCTEQRVLSKKLGYAGTIDRIYIIEEQYVVLDIKTTSVIQDKHWMQVGAYGRLALANKLIPQLDKTAILRLSEKTKTGFQYVTHEKPKDIIADYSGFNSLFSTWKYLNPERQPEVLDLPETLSLV